MRILSTFLLAASLFLTGLTAAVAQDDKGFLTNAIQNALSSGGRTVSIDGFRGALSSEASFDRMTIADTDGVWLTLEGVVLDWNRSALLRGRLEVENLTAQRLDVERLPVPDPDAVDLPDAEAAPFSLPELPVAIDIQQFGVEQINLGAALAGEPVQMTLEASALLNDEAANLNVSARRTDGKTGTFDIRANFDRASTQLDVAVNLEEEEAGILSRLLNIPDQPALTVGVEGSGPLDDFTSDVRVATAGQDRLTGQISLGTQDGAGDTPDRRVRADIGGDITALMAPRFREFFGDNLQLTTDAVLESGGRIVVNDFTLDAQAAQLAGQVTLNANKWPTFIDVTGTVANPDGTATLLPVGGDGTTVDRVELRVDYDAENGDALNANFDITGLSASGTTVEQLTLALDGTLQGSEAGSVGDFRGDVTFAAQGLGLSNPATAEALGTEVSGKANVVYVEGQPAQISGLELTGADYGLTGDVVISGLESGFATQLDARLEASDLSRFSALAGRELDGQASLAVQGGITPLSGEFDITATGTAEDITTGIAQADAVLDGTTQLSLGALRNAEGTFLRDLVLENPALSLTGSAELRTDNSRVQARAQLNDVSLVLPQYEGPITVTANAVQDARGWTVDAQTDGPYNAQITVDGLVTGPDADVTFAATVPQIENFVQGGPVSGPVQANGTLRQTPEGWRIDTQATGPLDARASVEGLVAPVDITFDLSLPEINPLVPQVNGPVSATGTLTQTAEGFVIDTDATGPYDLRAEVQGALTPMVDITFDVALPDINPVVPQLNGEVTATGSLTQTEDGFVIDTSATGPYDLRADVQGALTPMIGIDFNVTLPDIAPVVPQLSGEVTATGSLTQTADGFVIDTSATGPYDLTADIAGALTPMIDVTFDLDLPDLNPVLPQARGPVAASGVFRQTEQGFYIDTKATGPYEARAMAEGFVTGPDISLTFDVSVPNMQPFVPRLTGALDASGTVRQTDQGIAVDVNASGPYGARAVVEGLATGPNTQLTFDISVPRVEPFVPGVPGALNASGTLRQAEGGYAVDVNASGPYGVRAAVQGVATGPNANVSFDVSLPDVGVFVEEINGPLNVTGTARAENGGYRIATDATGPSGTQATIGGTVGTDGTLNLDVQGTAPLGLAQPFLAPRVLTGIARFDLSVNGPPALSSVSGTVRTSGATLTDPSLRISLNNIDGTVRLDNSRAEIDLTANAVDGGGLYRTSLSGQLQLAGPLTGGAMIRGRIDVGETEVNVPSTGLTSIGDIPPITQVNPRPGVIATRAKAGLEGNAAGDDPAAGPSQGGFGLDILISAPNRIFVRGRGLDAELGGSLTLTGTTNNIISAGSFDLVRGRLDILGKRFVLREGSVQFQGDFIPYIRFVTATQTSSGCCSNPPPTHPRTRYWRSCSSGRVSRISRPSRRCSLPARWRHWPGVAVME